MGKINWNNVWKVFLIGFVGYMIGTISTMLITLKYIDYFLKY